MWGFYRSGNPEAPNRPADLLIRRSKYGIEEVAELKRLRETEARNAEQKRMHAELALANVAI
jgi:hypothetical protein